MKAVPELKTDLSVMMVMLWHPGVRKAPPVQWNLSHMQFQGLVE
jgi:hypothetical protein